MAGRVPELARTWPNGSYAAELISAVPSQRCRTSPCASTATSKHYYEPQQIGGR